MEQTELLLSILVMSILCIGMKVGFIGVAVWYCGSRPESCLRMLEMYQKNGRRAFFVGLINLLLGSFVALALMATETLAFIGILLFAVIAALAVLGYGIAYQHLGRRLVSSAPGDSPALAIVAGGVAIESAFLAPGIGQLLSLWVLFRGFGAIVLTLLANRRERNANDIAPVPPVKA